MKGWMLLDWICMTPHATEASSNTWHPEGRGDHRAACRGVGAAGEHVQQITQPHEGEDAAVTGEHLGQQL